MKKILYLILFFTFSVNYSQTNKQIGQKIDSLKQIGFIQVEDEPIFKGCESVKNKRLCFNNAVRKYFQKNFSVYELECLETKSVYNKQKRRKERECVSKLKPGIHQINLSFVISKTGNLKNIVVKAPHPQLKKEAERICELLPKMIPGKSNGKAIDVAYTLPINYKLE